MSKNPIPVFTMDKKQHLLFLKWEKEQDKKVSEKQGERFPNYGAIGGAYTFSFTPTSIGMIIKATNCVTKETIDLTVYEDF